MGLLVLCVTIIKTTSRIVRWGRLLFLPYFGCSYSLLRDNKLLHTILISTNLLLFSANGFADSLNLSSDTEIATAGFYQLSWSGIKAQYQLQESSTAVFTTFQILYEGDDRATVISGKPDGDYYYRIRVSNDQQLINSNVVKVTVAHHPLRNAFLFFLAGAVVFLATLFMVIKGKRLQA